MTEDEEFEALEQRLNMKETKQPEALWLADELEAQAGTYDCAAAAELRRLHALNQELLEALKEIEKLPGMSSANLYARRAIAKAQGASNE